MKSVLFCLFQIPLYFYTLSQDSLETIFITDLDKVIIFNNMTTRKLLRILREDSSFYEAFKNLRLLTYNNLIHIEQVSKNEVELEYYDAQIHQKFKNKCRFLSFKNVKKSDKIVNDKNEFKLETVKVLANIFMYKDTICPSVKEQKNVRKNDNSVNRKKQQLKNFMFNPNSHVRGIPFLGNKLNIYDTQSFSYYNYFFKSTYYKDQHCWEFNIEAKKNLSYFEKRKIIIDKLITWFSYDDFKVIGREYYMSYNTPIYDFDIIMKVNMGQFEDKIVPYEISYNGNWKLIFKPRERVRFNSSFYEFKKPEP